MLQNKLKQVFYYSLIYIFIETISIICLLKVYCCVIEKNVSILAEFTRSNSTSSLNVLGGQNENEHLNKSARDFEFKAPLREQNCITTDNNTISPCEETGNTNLIYCYYF